jgi:hypothetical protein
MLRTGRVNQLRDNGTENTVSSLILISISFLTMELEDILTTSLINTSLLRLKMVERARDGTSINHLELSDLERRTNPSLLALLENLPVFCIQALTQDGGKCSNTLINVSLPISKTRESSLSRIDKTKKLNQFSWIAREIINHKCGEFYMLIN